MKEFAILKFLDKISFIFKSLGVDYELMRKILQVKFLMDERRVPTILMDGKNRESKNSFRSALGIYVFLGIFIGLFMLASFPLFIKMNIIIGIIMFMLMTTMISDFSAVLLDVKEKTILLSRPVDAKTLNAAKLVHIITYLFSIAVSISGGALIIGLIRYGILFFLLFLLVIILICGFLILFTALLYYAVITFFSGEKLKDIINYFQILLTVCMTLLYQLTGRIFQMTDVNMSFTPQSWHFFLPSSWFSAPFILLMEHNFNNYFILLSILGIIVPIITLTIYIKAVAPHFEKNLLKLNSGSSHVKKNRKIEAFLRSVSNILCPHQLEKVFFRFTMNMLSNERKLKLSIYPSLVFAIIFPFIFFLSFFHSGIAFADSFEEISTGKYYLYLYFSVLFLALLFPIISLSENYKGAWVYKALPVDNPAMVFKGAFKAFAVKYIIPVYLWVSLFFIVVFGIKVVVDLVLIFINLIMLMLSIFYSSKKELPFSVDFQYMKKRNRPQVIILSMVLTPVLAGIHYVVLNIPFGIMINIALSLIITGVLWHVSFQMTWNNIAEKR